MKNLSLSITEFAIPSPLVGSIEAYSGYGGVPDVGVEIHKAIQEQRATEHAGYEAERPVAYDFSFGEYSINVSGRMDGICDDPVLWIEEIKSAYDINKLAAKIAGSQDHPYKRQLQTYGYFHFKQTRQMPHLRFCLVDSRRRTEEFIDIPLNIEEYEAWLDRRLADIVHSESMFEAARERRKKNKKLVFPFEEQRPGQTELMASIDEQIKKDSRMLIQAPTGLGKTMGVTLPTLSHSLGRGQKMIYLTAKNSQHTVAEDAVSRLQEKGASIRSLTLHAKAKMCFKEEVLCDPAHCEYAKDHYTKMDENHVHEKILKKRKLNEKSIKKIAEEFQVCPFEVQMEGAKYADVVIGDYNYIFSPNNVRERLSKNSLGRSTSKPNLVIDEAHNLTSRSTDYFSAELMLDEIKNQGAALQKELPSVAMRKELETWIEEIERVFKEIHASVNGHTPKVITIDKEMFLPVRELAQKFLNAFLESDMPLRRQDPAIVIYNAVVTFVDLIEGLREEFVVIYETDRRFGRRLKIVCCDASWWLKEIYCDFSSVVAFSATMKPFEYYRELLGLPQETTICAEFTSPFPSENRKLLIVPQISTKLKDRVSNLSKIRSVIENVVKVQPGNYFVFCPSFDFLEQIATGLELPDFEILRQTRFMNKNHIEDVLAQLRGHEKPTLVLAVQGGVFSEGVDYPGNDLIGALIVGPALPVFNFEREQMRQYYEKKFGHGFDYAYTFPAMARTIQSAGRVIRSSTDRGLIVLMDKRFLDRNYVDTMPSDWVEGDAKKLASQQILADVREFWNPEPTS